MTRAARGVRPDAPQDAAFRLVPWGADPTDRRVAFSLTGSLARQGRNLAIHYLLQGPLHQLALPAAADPPERRDELWRATCLEFFLAPRGEDPYWEFNLSPAGHWNAYRFSGYRSGMAPDPGYPVLPFQVRSTADALRLDLACALPAPLGPDQPLEVGVCAVIASRGGALSHWALAHPGAEPDFHRREGFQLRI
jgi:hypothetical protein